MIRSVAYIPSSELEKMFPVCMAAFDGSSVACHHSFGDNTHSMIPLSEILEAAWEDFTKLEKQDLTAGKTGGYPHKEEVFKLWQFMQPIGGDMLVDLET